MSPGLCLLLNLTHNLALTDMANDFVILLYNKNDLFMKGRQCCHGPGLINTIPFDHDLIQVTVKHYMGTYAL